MGRRIPRLIKQQIIRKWLEGKFRDRIAEELNISQGAVSNIIKDFGSDDPEFCLLREVALKIRNQNMDVSSFASLVRLLEVLKEKKLLVEITGQETFAQMQARLEAQVVALEVFCFKEKLHIEDFASLVTNMNNAAEKLGIPLDKFPDYINDLKRKIDALLNDIDQLEKKKQEVLKNYEMTSESLEEYRANKPLVSKIKKLERALDFAEQAFESEKRWSVFGEGLEWSVYVDEINKINKKLSNSHYSNLNRIEILSVTRLKELVTDVFRHPSEYPETIRAMMREYNSRHRHERR